MWRARFAVASLAALATLAILGVSGRAQDQLRVAVGGRGIGETFVTEVGDKAGLFKRHNLALDIFYTDGGGETQQAVISNSAQIGVASGFLGAIGVFVIEKKLVEASAFALSGAVLTFFGFMHGESVGLAVTPTVAIAYAIVAAFLFGLSRSPMTFSAPMEEKAIAATPAE